MSNYKARLQRIERAAQERPPASTATEEPGPALAAASAAYAAAGGPDLDREDTAHAEAVRRAELAFLRVLGINLED